MSLDEGSTSAGKELVEELTAEVTRDCLITRTRQISRLLTAIYDHELRRCGIRSPQFTLLVTIARLQPVSRLEIGRQNHQERSTLTRNLRLLISNGWVEEVPSPSPRVRRKLICLTAAGSGLLASAAPAWRAAQGQARLLLEDSGVNAVMEIADRLPGFDLSPDFYASTDDSSCTDE
jgi:DNA-binding MarR family transcriptional regulator